MDTPTNKMPEYYEYKTKTEDQGKALDEACAFALAQPWLLTSVILQEKVGDEYIFIITYVEK
jgi:hypothetical protein